MYESPRDNIRFDSHCRQYMSQHEVSPFLYTSQQAWNSRGLIRFHYCNSAHFIRKVNILINAHLRLVWLSSSPVQLYSIHPNTIPNLLQKQFSHQSSSSLVGDTTRVTWHQPPFAYYLRLFLYTTCWNFFQVKSGSKKKIRSAGSSWRSQPHPANLERFHRLVATGMYIMCFRLLAKWLILR